MCSRTEGSVHRHPTAALLVFLAGATGARIVPPDLGSTALWFTPVGTGTDGEPACGGQPFATLVGRRRELSVLTYSTFQSTLLRSQTPSIAVTRFLRNWFSMGWDS